MTFNELESTVEALTLRLARVESEHRHLLKTYEEMTGDREKLHRETGETMKLFSRYWDDRIGEVVERVSTSGADSEKLAALLREIGRDTGALMAETLAAQEARIMQRVAVLFEKLAAAQGGIDDAVTRLLDAARSHAADSGASAR